MEEIEEPTLPRLPGVSWDEQSQSFSNNPRKRARRTRDSNAPPSSAFNSSDPAIFSSDDDPALENYTPGRHKRRYVGTWESQEPASADSTFDDMSETPRPKRTFSRQKDSGVFIGSDCDDGDETLQHFETPKQSRLTQLNVTPRPHISKEESTARAHILWSIDDGQEVIDLHGSGLEHLSNETVSPLGQIARIPIVAKDVAFEHREPELKLYLSSNLLTRLPGALFDLNNLTVLSLRGNELRELPPSICKLTNLQELNVAQNNLQWLPIELLDLFDGKRSLERLMLFPNPFVRPVIEPTFTNENWTWSPPADAPMTDVKRPHFVASKPSCLADHRSDIEYYNARGAREPDSVSKAGTAKCSVPSLVELVMRKCSQSSSLEAMQDMMTEFGLYEGLFARAIEQKYEGGLLCSRCRRQIVVPAEQWIEWRAVSRRSAQATPERCVMESISLGLKEDMVPFQYRVCTAACGQQCREGSGETSCSS